MQQVTRRSLIGQALAAGAGASVVSSFELSDIASAEQPHAPNAGYDPNYVAGRILSRRRAGRFIVETSEGRKVIRVTDPSVVWKKGLQGQLPLELGDRIRARGERASDGTWAVSAAWVDIQNFEAKVLDAGQSRFAVALGRWPGRSVPIALQANSEVENRAGRFVRNDAAHLREDDILRIVGYGDLAAGKFVATRVFVFAPPGATIPGPDPETALPARGPRPSKPDSLCPYYWYGITSWFDCSGGACDSGCPECNSNYDQMAWPRLEYCCGCNECNSDCGGNTCSASCCSGLPTVQCGTTVPIYEQCTNKGVNCVVTDCGPCVHCHSSYGCQNYIRVKFDLPAAAFSAIAPLSYGLADVQATTYAACG